jgi:hypothetical protein
LAKVVRQWLSEGSERQDNRGNPLVAGLDAPEPSHTE